MPPHPPVTAKRAAGSRKQRGPFAHLFEHASTRSSDHGPASTDAPATRLTARQQQILDWIRAFIDTEGMPPTRAEIATGLGFTSASSAEDHLQALAKKGALELLPGASRGLRLKDLPGVPVQGTLPLVGRVAAGSPILAAEHIEGNYRVDAALFSPPADYLLRVRGMSMKDVGIVDGDLLAVHRTTEARTGQIVVARLSSASGDEVTVKRLKRRGREIALLPENVDFAPIVVDPAKTELAIEGIAVGLLRTGTWK